MEVKVDIMQAIADGACKPAHIMYRSGLSWNIMHSLMSSLDRQGLIRATETEGKRTYSLTDKGIRVLQTFQSLRKQLAVIVITPQVSKEVRGNSQLLA